MRWCLALALLSGCGHASSRAMRAAGGALAEVAIVTVLAAATGGSHEGGFSYSGPDRPAPPAPPPPRAHHYVPDPSLPSTRVDCAGGRSYALACSLMTNECQYETSDGHHFECAPFCSTFVPEALGDWCLGF